MRLHIAGLPHAQSVRSLTTCAFTQKNIKFCKMLGSRDWDMTLYTGDQCDATHCDHVPLYTAEEQHAWYGNIDANTLPTKAGIWDSNLEPWRVTNTRAVEAIRLRAEPHDIVCLTGGYAHKPIADALPEMLCVEHAAGYEGIFAPYVCFESYAWRHYLYGKHGWDGRYYDTVIPNFFDPDEWSVSESKDDYLLFVGRLVQRKGVLTALEIAKATGRRLLLAGSGVIEARPGRVVCEELTLEHPLVEYVGTLEAKERNELMGKAHAVLVPTSYVEPFGAVAVEAQLCGSPAITTNFGAFPETVADEFRFDTLAEAVGCVEHADEVDPHVLSAAALARFSLEAIAPRYERWFENLNQLWDAGWYAT